MFKPIVVATLMAGTLDLVAAFFFAGRASMSPGAVLHFVASGPLGDGALQGDLFLLVGALVHYVIMAVMVMVFMLAATRVALLTRQPIPSGVAYGLGLWFVMYWIVRPARWENLPPPSDPGAIAGQLFCHLILVGIPIALVARHYLGKRTAIAAAA
jgi:hypothetical protein